MNKRLSFIALLLLAMAAAAVVPVADAAKSQRGAGESLVFVQTNEPSGNRVLVYSVTGSGALAPAGAYATGGNGGVAAPGDESDHLASQGSLVYDASHELLFAVNAGSDTVSTFSVHGAQLELRDVVASGGAFPASIAVQDKLVYVLNSGGSGIVQGFRIAHDKLQPIQNSARSLGLANSDPPNFLTSPGQVGFTSDGGQLIVTTKASGSTIDVFQVQPNGRLSPTPVLNPSATPVPFAFTFTPTGRLAVGEAGASSVSTYVVAADGSLSGSKSQTDGQTALCWILRVGRYYYVSNTGSNNLSAFQIGADGQPALVGATGIVATTDPGPIDATSPSGTSFLYAQTGGGSLHSYRVNSDGTLSQVAVVRGLPLGMEGIAST